MQNIISKAEKIHCIGIGGSGVSALAAILHEQGKNITGTDRTDSPIVKLLRSKGIDIKVGHNHRHIPLNTDLIIYSPAIPYDNSEREKARKLNIPEMSYPKAIGELTKEKDTIAICGTHGKTTVTSMITAAFLAEDKDPSVIVGSHIMELEKQNYRLGKGDYLLLESCEYCRNFLNYRPNAIVLNNIDLDHLDYYKDQQDYENAFFEFAELLPDDGLLIANYDDKNVVSVCNRLKKEKPEIKIISFGTSPNADFPLEKHNDISLKIPGKHNVMNALAAISLCISLGFDRSNTVRAINNFSGAKRRFELVAEIGKTQIYDDYAHHPSEIKATLGAIREKYGYHKKVLCIFQPHQHSRTKKLLSEFADSFNEADEVIIPNIYKVRDTVEDIKSINEENLIGEIRKHQPNVINGDGLGNTEKIVREKMSNFDVIITMGAGDITNLASKLKP
jgi:UDP-N-acetylmuramate--alanine ligase